MEGCMRTRYMISVLCQRSWVEDEVLWLCVYVFVCLCVCRCCWFTKDERRRWHTHLCGPLPLRSSHYVTQSWCCWGRTALHWRTDYQSMSPFSTKSTGRTATVKKCFHSKWNTCYGAHMFQYIHFYTCVLRSTEIKIQMGSTEESLVVAWASCHVTWCLRSRWRMRRPGSSCCSRASCPQQLLWRR